MISFLFAHFIVVISSVLVAKMLMNMIVIYLLVCSKCYFMVIRQVREDLEHYEYHFGGIVVLYRTLDHNNYFGQIAFWVKLMEKEYKFEIVFILGLLYLANILSW